MIESKAKTASDIFHSYPYDCRNLKEYGRVQKWVPLEDAERLERKLDVYTENLAFQIVNMTNKNIELELKFVKIKEILDEKYKGDGNNAYDYIDFTQDQFQRLREALK